MPAIEAASDALRAKLDALADAVPVVGAQFAEVCYDDDLGRLRVARVTGVMLRRLA